MKTKTFLLLCFLLCLATAQLSAQKGKNGTGAVSWIEVWDGYYCPIVINGVQIDVLTGTVTMHNVAIFKNGSMVKANQIISGEVKSSNPPYEVFNLSEVDRSAAATGLDNFHANLLGNYGTHYILTGIYDFSTGEFTLVKIIEVGKDK